MIDEIGYSVYLSNFEQLSAQIADAPEGGFVFTSFHIKEEMGEDYIGCAEKMCRFLKNKGLNIIGDVSKRTLEVFDCPDAISFARRMGIDILRFDYGFSDREIVEAGQEIPVCINASTVPCEQAAGIAAQVNEMYAVHNFYPRPETGLDEEVFDRINAGMQKAGIRVFAFIPGDENRRGPLYEGLPTLEKHRGQRPYAACVDMMRAHQVDGILCGDGIISEKERRMLEDCRVSGVITVPVLLDAELEWMYDRVFTVRADSPRRVKRIQESREYSCFGREISPKNCDERRTGSITIDNIRYQRYSGEVQIVTENLPADKRVNVAGRIKDGYLLLCDALENGRQIKLVR